MTRTGSAMRRPSRPSNAPSAGGRAGAAEGSRARGLAARLPQVDRPGRVARERQGDPAAPARRSIEGMDGLDDGAAITTVLAGRLPLADAGDEVLHLLREAVVPDLLVDREGPADRRSGLLDGVAVAAPGKGAEGVPMKDVRVGLALAAEDLRAV